jgi:hypothetical protein
METRGLRRAGGASRVRTIYVEMECDTVPVVCHRGWATGFIGSFEGFVCLSDLPTK